MEIYPLQIGKVDWEIYIKIYQEFTGESPTRGLDSVGTKVNEPIAFLKTLDLHNDPTTAISQDHLCKHLFFSFIIITDLVMIAQIAERSSLSLTFIEKRNKAFVILSGTLLNWKYAIVNCCNIHSEKELRELFYEIQVRFIAAGFKEIWNDYREFPKGDGTTAIARRK